MKHFSALMLCAIFSAQLINAACAPVPAGTPVWYIAADSVVNTVTVDSLIDAVAPNFSQDLSGTYTALDALLAKLCTVESQAEQLSSAVTDIETSMNNNVSKTCILSSNVDHLEQQVSALSFSGVFTALNGLQAGLNSKINVLSGDLIDIQNQITGITANEIAYAWTVESKLHTIDTKVVIINSLLADIPTQIATESALINSQLDDISSRLNPIESKTNNLNTVIINGFAGTFTALDVNLQLACTIDSLVDHLTIRPTDFSGVYTALNQLDQTVSTIGSKVNGLNTSITTDASLLGILNSNIDGTLSKISNVESKITPLPSLTDVVNSKLGWAAGTGLPLVSSEVDVAISELGLIDSKTNVINSRVMNINVAANISKLLPIESRLEVINSKVTHIDASDSKINAVNSKVDNRISQSFTIESAIDTAESLAERISSIIDVPTTILSKVSVVESKTLNINNSLDVLNASLDTTNSTLDIIIPIEADSISKLPIIESYLEHLPLNLSAVALINSNLDSVNSLSSVIQSKLNVIIPTVHVLNSKAMVLHSDFQQTWTILDALNTKLTIDQSLETGISSKLDLFNITNDIASTFSVIAAIQQKEDTVNSKLSVTQSLVDAIQTDFSSIFTALDKLNNTVNTNGSKIDVINSEVDVLVDYCGFPIYNRNLPKTISTPGRYFFAENLVYNPAAIGTTAITIATDNVTIDLDGRSLTQLNGKSGTGTTNGILTNANLSNIRIMNGTVHDLTQKGISFSANCSNILVENMNITNVGNVAASGFAGNNSIDCDSGCSQCIIRNCFIVNPKAAGILINGAPILQCRDIIIDNCECNGNSIAANGISLTNSNRLFVENCITEKNAVGLNLEGLRSFAIENSVAENNTSTGINMSTNDKSFMYVANSSSANVKKINLTTNAVTATITVGTTPFGIAITPDNAFVYVVNRTDSTVSKINTATNTVAATISLGASTTPDSVAITPNNAFAYVTNANSVGVKKISVSTNAVVATIAGIGSTLVGIAITPNGAFAYVASNTSAAVSKINLSTDTVAATISVGSAPTGVAITPDGTFAYVANRLGNSVSKINVATDAVTTPVTGLVGPFGVAVSPNGAFVYVANSGTNTVSKIDTSTDTVVATITVGTNPRYIAITPDNAFAYVTNSGNSTVSKINLATNTVVTTISTGISTPWGITLLFQAPSSSGSIRNCITNNNNVGIFATGTIHSAIEVLECTAIHNTLAGISFTTAKNNYIAFNSLISNGTNMIITGTNTMLGNFAFNSTAVGNPNNTNYSVLDSVITNKVATVSQTGAFPTTEPTEWMNINMLP